MECCPDKSCGICKCLDYLPYDHNTHTRAVAQRTILDLGLTDEAYQSFGPSNGRKHSNALEMRKNAGDLEVGSLVVQTEHVNRAISTMRDFISELKRDVRSFAQATADLYAESKEKAEFHNDRIEKALNSMSNDMTYRFDTLARRLDHVVEKNDPIMITVLWLNGAVVNVTVDKSDHVFEIKKQAKSKGYSAVSLFKQNGVPLDDLMIIGDMLDNDEEICGIDDPNCVTMGDVLKRLDSIVERVIDIEGRLPTKN